MARSERWDGSELASWERWGGSEVARWERWKSSEVTKWEVPGFVRGWWGKIMLYCFRDVKCKQGFTTGT